MITKIKGIFVLLFRERKYLRQRRGEKNIACGIAEKISKARESRWLGGKTITNGH
jgi:hypothetical protein